MGTGAGAGVGFSGLLGLLNVLLGNLLGGSLGVGGDRLLDLGLGLDGLGGGSLRIAVGGSDLLGGGDLFQLLLDDGGVDGRGGSLLGGLLNLSLLGDGLGSVNSILVRGLLLGLSLGFNNSFLLIIADVSQDIVHHEVAGGLRSKDEGLNELLGLSRLDGALADDLNDDVVEGGLRVDVCDADLAVLEVERLDPLLDVLRAEVISYQTGDGQ
ncbi:hypothetical protein Cob_v008630 [Colletotrichum orbiculare MAFF 240422]|uniref:Uncharacterized protein n=1 Tax=Colletotrichum orbiculare (strain 104-T / ATCC 96160 / CBS 514.97 / LARS 414 / MAFF 240422) TaxID=1213857 RepID=A0A484FLN8_COLOR|nr:hypothetical protein Cob_v008630 [Colletotrichum orbiculare MAFF 240422]